MSTALYRLTNTPVEARFTVGIVFLTVLLSLTFGVPLVFPTSNAAQFVGIQILLPMVAFLLWLGLTATFGKWKDPGQLLLAVICYAAVMWAHFNMKLWAHHLNPVLYDEVYWKTDQSLRALVDFSMRATLYLANNVPLMDTFYLHGFIILFAISFTIHSLRSAEALREVLLAALFFQGLGGISYLLAPALGPFIYETGAIPWATGIQSYLLEAYQTAKVEGRVWFENSGNEHFLTGVAAMPSLHAGGAYLFTWFIAKYERPLLFFYLPIFFFILIAAVGTRWHYVVDIPAGLLLAQVCIWLAGRSARDAASCAGRAAPPSIWRRQNRGT